MATIQFKGKPAVWNHHLSVPYHTLEKDEKKSLKGANADENLIVQGDNLLALKALLPKYQGKVKCIYIDPPYNTGNEGWVYNDNVNSPTIRDWMGKAVGKEGEDLTRHDKWLCMMTPRLKLLREFLTDDGAIFISIDDNEASHLRMVLDEVFGEENFVAQIIWKNKTGGGNDAKDVTKEHEYLLCYSKSADSFGKLVKGIEDTSKYIHEDEYVQTRGKYSLEALYRSSLRYSDALFYPIVAPDGSKILPNDANKDSEKHNWRWSKSTFQKKLAEGRVEFKKTKNGWRVYSKQYQLEDDDGDPRVLGVRTVWDFVGSRHGTEEVKDLFDGGKFFDYPKPVALLKFIASIAAGPNDIILDSFAGSGTTAHAVINLNKEDGNNRKFILIQLPEEISKETPASKAGFKWVHEIMLERVKRAIKKDKSDAGFTYYTLGPAIDAETLLEGKKLPTFKEFAKYVYYLATGKNHPDEGKINEKTGLVGKDDGASVYLLYEQDVNALKKLAITLDWAQKTHDKDAGRKIVYAPACYLDDEALDQYNIRFVGIPYNLFERSI